MEKRSGCMIFAGGTGRRLGNVNKARLNYNDTTFGTKILSEAEKLGIPCFISAAAYPWEQSTRWELVQDEIKDEKNQFIGPTGGLFTCLKRAKGKNLSGLYTIPCDMPFFRKEQIERMADAGNNDAVIWQTRDGRIHPVCGFYKVSCLPYIEKMIRRRNYRLRDLFAGISVKICRTDEVHMPDSWFANINQPEDYNWMLQRISSPPVLAVSGRKNSGKTTLLMRVIQNLSEVGLRCGVIKHDGHEFEADVPGTDSYKLKRAGAYGTAVYSGTKYMITKGDRDITCQKLLGFFKDADFIFLEGQKDSSYPKIEVLRQGVSEHPVTDPETVIAYVTDGIVPPLEETGGKPVLCMDNLDEILETIVIFADKSGEYRERQGV